MNIRLPKRLKDGKPVDPETAKDVRKIADDAALKSGSPYRIHVYHVYNDPEFDAGVQELRRLLEDFYYKDVSLSPDSDHLLKEHSQSLINFADRYCIATQELRLYADGLYDEGVTYGREIEELGGLVESSSHGLYYKIGPKTTLEQIRADWKHIEYAKEEHYGKRSGKRKATLNHELVYAVFKARSQSPQPTFETIFRQYSAGQLSGYTGKNTNQYKSKDELERFFNKFSPYTKTGS